MPFSYFTDGGTFNDDYHYFLHNIFTRTYVCHSSKVPKNSNIQAYLGRRVIVDPVTVNPKLFKVHSDENPNIISVPYENYLADKQEEETMKQLGSLVIHNMPTGYTCFVQSFAIFVSEKEIKISKSLVVKAFEGINTEQAFLDLHLPIKQVIDVSEGGVINKAYEIDLNYYKHLEKQLKVPKLDCFPILWVISNPSKAELNIKFIQRIACKYLVVKLIDSHKTSASDNNIDMYNMTLNGFNLYL